MSHDNQPYIQTPDSADDIATLRYLLQTIKGISPVSGGSLSETLEPQYIAVEEDQAPHAE